MKNKLMILHDKLLSRKRSTINEYNIEIPENFDHIKYNLKKLTTLKAKTYWKISTFIKISKIFLKKLDKTSSSYIVCGVG